MIGSDLSDSIYLVPCFVRQDGSGTGLFRYRRSIHLRSVNAAHNSPTITMDGMTQLCFPIVSQHTLNTKLLILSFTSGNLSRGSSELTRDDWVPPIAGFLHEIFSHNRARRSLHGLELPVIHDVLPREGMPLQAFSETSPPPVHAVRVPVVTCSSPPVALPCPTITSTHS
jgi:hypothetical protein